MTKKGDTWQILLVFLVLAVMGNIGQYFQLVGISEQFKILEATYAADTADRGNTERKLIEVLNNIKPR